GGSDLLRRGGSVLHRRQHLMGWSHGNTRVCSAITDIDVLLRSCCTKSANVYQMPAPPAVCLSGPLLDLWGTWKARNRVIWEQDVTRELENAFREAESEWRIDASSVPTDFPTDYFLGAVSGVQPKLLARKSGSRYIVGPTSQELQERYELCLRLAAQYRRHASSFGTGTMEPQTFVSEALADWSLSTQERHWLVENL
ncbi:hypothetical protein, partial [Castellaniella sp.]|uniref:hypothetical protein n=1 Tax=Castellaniella sp. TaxID=1955812 RepID=UPI002AFEA9F7